jgi:hypothetical protein
MFFLLRCVFWLGLVYLAMARDAGALPEISFPPQQAVLASAQTLESVCARAPTVCAEAVRRAGALGGRAAEARGRSVQTLRAADLETPWRGRPTGG